MVRLSNKGRFAADLSGGSRQMKINTIIWDMDGTVLDTLTDLRDSVNYVLGLYDMPGHTIED